MYAKEKMRKNLAESLGIDVPTEEITSESVQLYADEIDDRLVPKAVFQQMDELVTIEMASCQIKGDEFLYVQLKLENGKTYEVWLKNDAVFDINS